MRSNLHTIALDAYAIHDYNAWSNRFNYRFKVGKQEEVIVKESWIVRKIKAWLGIDKQIALGFDKKGPKSAQCPFCYKHDFVGNMAKISIGSWNILFPKKAVWAYVPPSLEGVVDCVYVHTVCAKIKRSDDLNGWVKVGKKRK